ncbi:MAG: hypothetical protein LBP22_16400 [Deltaproteobacteria bacterium]|jgi:hypothetical protein|nr:hypothetical protein [Deltaproteobacteria bacterium]
MVDTPNISTPNIGFQQTPPAPPEVTTAALAPPPQDIHAAQVRLADQQFQAARLDQPQRQALDQTNMEDTLAVLKSTLPQAAQIALSVTQGTMLLNQVDEGQTDRAAALSQIRELEDGLRFPDRPDLPADREAFLAARTSLANMEKYLLTSPFRQAAQKSGNPQVTEAAGRFTANLENLKGAKTTEQIKQVAAELRSFRSETAGNPAFGALSGDIAASVDHLINLADHKAALSQSQDNLQKTADNQESFQQALKAIVSETATPDEALTALTNLTKDLGLTEAGLPAPGSELKEIRQGLAELRDHIDLEPKAEDLENNAVALFEQNDFTGDLFAEGLKIGHQLDDTAQSAENFRGELRTVLNQASADLLEKTSPKGAGFEEGELLTPEAFAEAVEDLSLRASLADLPSEEIGQLKELSEPLAAIASAKQTLAAGGGGTDLLDQVLSQIDTALDKLPPNSLARERLANHRQDFLSFQKNSLANLTRPYDTILRSCQEADKLTAQGVIDLAARLDQQSQQAAADPRIGQSLKQELTDRLSAARDNLLLDQLTSRELANLESGRGEGLSEIEARVGRFPDGAAKTEALKKITDFSANQAERIKTELKNLLEQSSLPAGPNSSKAGIMPSFNALKDSAARVLTAADLAGLGPLLADFADQVPKDLAKKMIEGLSDKLNKRMGLGGSDKFKDEDKATRKAGLEFLLSRAGPGAGLLLKHLEAQAEVKAIEGQTTSGHFLRLLAQEAGKAAAYRAGNKPARAEKAARQAISALEELARNNPALDGTVLELKLALCEGFESPELTTAQHVNSRVKDSLFRSISQHAPELLEFVGAKKADDLDAETLKKMAAALPNPDQSPFNVLLMKALHTELDITLRLSQPEAAAKDEAAVMKEFREALPKALADRGDEALKGLFRLGLKGTQSLDEAKSLIDRTRSLSSAPDVRYLMQGFTAKDPKFRLHQALLTETRNFLVAADQNLNLEGKSLDELLPLVAGTFRTVAGQDKILPKLLDRLRSLTGLVSDTLATTDIQTQLTNAVATMKANEKTYNRLSLRAADLLTAIESLVENIVEGPRLDPDKAKLTGKKLPPKSEATLADPTDFLYRQGAVKIVNGQAQVDTNVVQGETISLVILGFAELFSGQAEGLPRPGDSPQAAKDFLEAVKSLKLPGQFNLEEMRSDFGIFRTDPEGAELLKAMEEIQKLDPADADLAQKLEEKGRNLLNLINKYNLTEKARIILAFKMPSSLDATISTRTKSGLPSPLAVLSKNALNDGLDKAMGTKAATKQAEALRRYLEKSLIGLRGAGVNQIAAQRIAEADYDNKIMSQLLVLHRSVAELGSQNLLTVNQVSRVAIMGALEVLGQQAAPGAVDYEDAAGRVLAEDRAGHPEQAPLYREAMKILTGQLGLNEDEAKLALQMNLTQRLRIAAGSRMSPGTWLNSVIDGVSRSLDTVVDDIKREWAMTSGERKARDARVMTEIAQRMVDGLAPDSTMAVSLENSVTVGGSVKFGPLKGGAAVKLASETGLAVARGADGKYKVAISAKHSGGLGLSAGFDAVVGGIEASLGASLGSSQGIEFTFDNAENCTAFLAKAFGGTWSPDDAARLCSGLATFTGLETGVAASVELEVGKLKALDTNLVAFSAGFEASVHHESRTNVDTTAGMTTTEKGTSGRLSLSCQLGKAEAEEKEPTSTLGRVATNVAALDAGGIGAGDIIDQAGGGVEGADATEPNLAGVNVGVGRTGRVSAGVGLSAEGLTASVAFSASSRSSLTRATESGRLEGATFGTKLDFSGTSGQSGLRSYLTGQCGLKPEAVELIVRDVGQRLKAQGTDSFSLVTESALKPEVLAQAQILEQKISRLASDPKKNSEAISETRKELSKLMDDKNNYQLNEVQITHGRNVDIDISVFVYGRQLKASDEEVTRYSNAHGLLNPK